MPSREQTGAAAPLPRDRADELLYLSLRSIYHFERGLVEEFGLGFQEIILLQLLRRRESARIGEIAKALEVPVFSATRLVKRLEAEGLLRKEPAAGDGRGISAVLEPKGGKLVDAIEAASYRRIGGAAASLSPREREAFVLVAERLAPVLGVEGRIGLEG